MHPALVVDQLRAQRVGEAADRVLGAAIGRLQRDRAVGEGRADLHDRALVAWPHPFQRRHRAPDAAEIGHFGGAAIFLRRDLGDRREDRRHRIVDPDVDRAELPLDGSGGAVDRTGIGDIGRHGKRFAP